MKMLQALIGAALLIAAAPAVAAAPVSPLLGSWSVDVSQLPMPPEARPRSVTIRFSLGSAGQWTTSVRIVGADGRERTMVSVASLDGPAVRIDGDQAEADVAAVRLPSPGVAVLALGKDGHPASTRIYSLDPGGQTMTETAVSWDEAGRPTLRTHRLSRQR